MPTKKKLPRYKQHPLRFCIELSTLKLTVSSKPNSWDFEDSLSVQPYQTVLREKRASRLVAFTCYFSLYFNLVYFLNNHIPELLTLLLFHMPTYFLRFVDINGNKPF